VPDPIDNPGTQSGHSALSKDRIQPPRFRLSLLQAMIMVPVLAIALCILFLLLSLGWALTFGDYPGVGGQWPAPRASI
jgi:hypothetical protein